MGEFLPVVSVGALATIIFALQLRRYEGLERSLLALAFAAHVLASFSHVWMATYIYEGSDVFTYHYGGEIVGAVVRSDPGRFLPELGKLIFYGQPRMPVWVGEQTPSASMCGISTVLALMLSDSLYAMCLALSMLAFFGLLALYTVFRDTFVERYHVPLLAAILLVPSTIYWTSGLLKETVAVAAMGWFLYGVHRCLHRQLASGLAIVAFSAVAAGLVKPYVLVTTAIATAAWVYWHIAAKRSPTGAVELKPTYIVLGAAAGFGALLLVGSIFPQFSLERVADEVELMQRIGMRVRGGSYYALGDPASMSPAGRFVYAPLALLTSLFRPLIFEASSGMMAVNGLETTVITALFIRALVKTGRRSWSITRSSPLLMFALTFTVLFGVAVGLASTNLGSLSRYRSPLVPFFVALIAVCTVAGTQPKPAPAPAAVPVRPVVKRRPASELLQ